MREVFFILASVIIVVSSFFLTNKFSEQNTTFSRNLITTTNIAQEGINAVLDIQDQNTSPAITIESKMYTWSQLFDGTILLASCENSQDPTSNCSDFKLSLCNLVNSPKQQYCLVKNSTPYTDLSWKIDDSQFSRKIRITDGQKNTKVIIVFVWWNASDGLHKSALSRELKREN